MTTTANFQDLSKQIEQVIQEHIAASRKAAEAAVDRAFAAGGAPSKKPRLPGAELDDVVYLSEGQLSRQRVRRI